MPSEFFAAASELSCVSSGNRPGYSLANLKAGGGGVVSKEALRTEATGSH